MPRTCSTTLNKEVLRPIFELRTLACNESSKMDSTGLKIGNCSVLVYLVRRMSTIASTSGSVTTLTLADAHSISPLKLDSGLATGFYGVAA